MKNIIKHLPIIISFLFILVPLFFTENSFAQTIVSTKCPKDIDTAYYYRTASDHYFAKCTSSGGRYANVCYSGNPSCTSPFDTVQVCPEKSICAPIADSHCIQCISTEPKPIVSNKTVVSGTVTISGNVAPDTLNVYIEFHEKNISFGLDWPTGGAKTVGYTYNFSNTDDEYNAQMTANWKVKAYKAGKLVGESPWGYSGDGNYGISNTISMSVTASEEPPPATGSDCPASGSNPTHYCKSTPIETSDTIDSEFLCKDSSGTPSTTLKCYKKNIPPPPPDTTSCENPATWSPGTSYSCQLSGCPEGGTTYTGPDHGCPASKPTCCKTVIIPPPGAPKVLGYERSCTGGQISYKFNFTPGSDATYHKLQYVGVAKGDSTTVPVDQYNNYTSGMVIPPAGGNGFSPNIQVNYDILACNSVACTPDPQHWWSIGDTGSACTTGGATPTGPCSTHGGVKTGTTAEGVCDKKLFNGTDAKKTIAEGNPYYGKTYELRYTCNDPGTYDYINPDTTACNAIPWFDPPTGGGTTPGGAKTCYKDADNDGYGSSTGGTQTGQTTCAAGWSENNSDCYDQNASANPGQTGDFYVDRGDGSFDYNCNGQNDKKYATHGFGSLPTGTCLADMPSGTVGFSNDMQCGTTGTFRLCYKFKDTACGSTAESDAVSDTIGRPCPAGAAGSGWALVDLASVPQNCK